MRHLIALAALALTCAGADKKNGPVRAGNDAVDITASVSMDRQEVQGLLGVDPNQNLIISLITAVIGAVILLAIVKAVRRNT